MNMMIMSLTVVFLQIAVAGYGQKVSIDVDNASAREVLYKLSAQSGYDFVYDQQMVPDQSSISIHLRNVPLEDVLNRCFGGKALDIAFKANKVVVIKLKNGSGRDTQQREVSGRVTDQQGTAFPRVTVRVKGTNVATVSDVEGRYKIKVSGPDDVLVFSYVGFATIEEKAGDRTKIDVSLTLQQDNLDEVVVIGYGEVNRKDLTGSVGSVKIEDMAKAPVMSFDQALAGRIAGVQVSSSEGQPGNEGMNIVIRGANSLTQDNSPLYVVDGFPMEDFEASSLNPDDIASIDILKDASATAIYGARGANGVIIIETKKGMEGKPLVNLNVSLGFNEITKRMDLMSPYEFVKYQQELSPTAANQLYFTDGLTLDDYRDVKGTDWQDQIFRTAGNQIYNLSLRGGNKQTKYAFSGSVYDMDGIVINSGQKRYQGKLSLDQQISKKISANLIINYSSASDFGKFTSAGGSASNSFMYSVWGYRPVVRGSLTYDDEGDLVEDDGDFLDDPMDEDVNASSDSRFNPVLNAENEHRTRRNNTLSANGAINYAINKSLTLRLSGGVKQWQRKSEAFYNTHTSQGSPLRPSNVRGVSGNIRFDESTTWLSENTLTWKKKWNQQHSINALAGFTMQGSNSNNYGYNSQLVPNEELGMSGLDEGTPYATNAAISEYALASFLGRVNYTFKSRYLFTVNFRADGSSKFPVDKRWGYFPSGAFAWQMKEEHFLQKLDFISQSKLRVSYGLTGNNRVGDFSYLPAITLPVSFAYPFNNGTPERGSSVSNMGNADLKWESTAQLDIGYDLGLFNDRIGLTADVYRKTTSDLLLNANMPYYTGFSKVYKNIGKIQNQGLEITLNTVNIKSRNFIWESNFNISFNNNKILQLAENEDNMLSMMTWQSTFNSTPLYIARIGQPAALFYGYVWQGNYQYKDFDQNPDGSYVLKKNVPSNGDPRENIRPGDVKYKDLNGDGVVNIDDQTVLGRALPIHTGGFSNDFSYKNFSLNVLFQWSYGNMIYNANREIFEGNKLNSVSLNQLASYEDRWHPDNPSNTLFRTGGRGPNGFYSSRVLEDGSFLRLKTVALSYSLPKSLVERLRMSSLELHVAAQNLITWTNYTGMDPEVSVRYSVLTPGFDYSAYPRARTIVFGLKANF